MYALGSVWAKSWIWTFTFPTVVFFTPLSVLLLEYRMWLLVTPLLVPVWCSDVYRALVGGTGEKGSRASDPECSWENQAHQKNNNRHRACSHINGTWASGEPKRCQLPRGHRHSDTHLTSLCSSSQSRFSPSLPSALPFRSVYDQLLSSLSPIWDTAMVDLLTEHSESVKPRQWPEPLCGLRRGVTDP